MKNLHPLPEDNQVVLYVDAAECTRKEAYVVAVAANKVEGVAAVTIPAKIPEEAGAAIDYAMTIKDWDHNIISDTRTGIINLFKGRAHHPATQLTSKYPPKLASR